MTEKSDECRVCGNPIAQREKKRERFYCSDGCKQKAYRQRRDARRLQEVKK